ncbi:hypothetical protein GDO86_003011 [Hymenochirus boettgeri]|uniref:Acetylserotonin O-methyltransferase n=1 Tax=Hymenochirus boettgeri TaxID=247094 RepID=A0A8T2K4N1_9PIPI|nr:hypothetical protein GDO86_003011 [Hymenochirus boettgeri]
MSSVKDLDYPQKLFEYIDGFLVSKTMFTACELGIFDLLYKANEPLSTLDISTYLATSYDGTDRLLNACVGLKLLNVAIKNNEALFSNTDLSNIYLVKSSPRSLHHMMMYYSQTIYMCWHFLPDAIREGKSQYERAFGVSSEVLFSALYRSEEEMVHFMHSMDSIWKICGKDVIAAFDLSAFNEIYDLGGCSGALAKQIVSVYPSSTVTILDLPNVVQTAKKHFISDGDANISFHEGDFFNDPIPEADLYIMARIIHDWAEDKCLQLLNKLYKSCRSGGGVLIIEALLNEDRSGPLTSQSYSLNMLVQTEGKERTPSEYRKLLAESGFREFK